MKFKKILKDKKGVFGLNAVQSFFAIILGIAILSYVIVVVMGTLGGTTILTQLSSTVTNESGNINESGYTSTNAGLDGFGSFTVTNAIDSTTNTTISSGNYTTSSAGTITAINTSRTVLDEVGAFINATGFQVAGASTYGANTFNITGLNNYTDGSAILLGNATINATGYIFNASVTNWANVSVNYTYNAPADYDSALITYTYVYNSQQQNDLNSVLQNTSTGVTSFFNSINPVYAILAVLVIILVLVVLVRVVQNPSKQTTPQL